MRSSVFLVTLIWALCGYLVVTLTSSKSIEEEEAFDIGGESKPTVTYDYDRIDEVNKECAFIRKSAAELRRDDSRLYSIKEDLSFLNGDWWQDVGNAQILPFDDEGLPKNSSFSPLKLVSFWVTDVDHSHKSRYSVFVSGFMTIFITLRGSKFETLYRTLPEFVLIPRHTELSISFQGVYTESKKNGGERVVCLLGNTILPARETDSSNPWEWIEGFKENHQAPLLQDDQILLVLRYPKTFTLATRAIKGSMRSLNSKSNQKYFDDIHIFSQLGKLAHYEFGSTRLVSRACGSYPANDSMKDNGISIYKGNDFCRILVEFTENQVLIVVPNWKCNGTDEFCSTLGPFASGKEINATDGGFRGINLYMQFVRCEQKNVRGGATTARVSAVFRAILPSEILQTEDIRLMSASLHAAARRSGLSNMTVSAEGMWTSSSGQLCMVGCLGLVDAEGSSCNSRICLYIPITFSIKQRSIVLGSFTSISKPHATYFPLSFEVPVKSMQLWNVFRSSIPHYSYSKIALAGTVLEKNEPFSFGTVIKKSLLKFPKLEDSESLMSSLSLLSEDLTLQVDAVLDPLPNRQFRGSKIILEVVSLGPLFGRYWSVANISLLEEFHSQLESTEKQLLLNVSAQLMLDDEAYMNISSLYLEGLYDPHVGKMYLIGCRDVQASWKILIESMDLEVGLDCLIEVVVTYPPVSAQWLVNPTAKISITSQRTEDDPLYFSPVKLETLPIMYRRQREDILSRRAVEGILQVLTLTLVIACISSQLFYIRNNLDSVPYISLVMLGVQALGYCLPLVTNAEALFKKMAPESYETQSYDLDKSQWFYIVDYTVKFLVMVSFLLTLRLFQKVWKARARLCAQTPLQPLNFPSDKKVVIVTLTIHFIGFLLVLIVNGMRTSQKPLSAVKIMDLAGRTHTTWQWAMVLEEYVGLVQDFFLLPQVIGNFVWQIDCKPLKKLYFIGITVVRLLPHVYDYTRVPPVSNPYFSEEYEFVNPSFDFYSKFGDVAIPLTAIVLAVAVYVQQRWNYEKLSVVLRQTRILLLRSQPYERLATKSPEAELVPGVNVNSVHEKECTVDE